MFYNYFGMGKALGHDDREPVAHGAGVLGHGDREPVAHGAAAPEAAPAWLEGAQLALT